MPILNAGLKFNVVFMFVFHKTQSLSSPTVVRCFVGVFFLLSFSFFLFLRETDTYLCCLIVFLRLLFPLVFYNKLFVLLLLLFVYLCCCCCLCLCVCLYSTLITCWRLVVLAGLSIHLCVRSPIYRVFRCFLHSFHSSGAV